MKKFTTLTSLLFISIALLAQSHYKIVKKIPVEGNGGWDYISVDEKNQKILVSHSSMAQSVGVKSGMIDGTISDTKGIHGIAIADDLEKGFTSNGRDSSVTVFNLKTYEVITKVTVTGTNPDAILYDPFTKRVFTFNGRSSNSTVIDATTNKVIATIPLDGKPEFAVTDGKGKIFVNIEDKALIEEINSSDMKVTRNWSIAPGQDPSGLAIDVQNHLLFSGCGNKMMVVSDADAGKVITTLPIGDRCDGVAFDPTYKRAYSSNGEGTITVIQEESAKNFKVLETFPTQVGARTITVDKTTHHLYLPVADFESAPSQNNRRPAIKDNSFHILDIETLK